MATPSSEMIHRVRSCPILIGGFYRSGTSLLRRMLDSHRNIYCGPEVKFFRDFYGDYRRDELAHLRLFSTLRTMGLDEGTLLEVFGKAFIECHERAARKSGKHRWADKNPENVLYLKQWSLLLDGQFFFLHVVRNPLDALASLNEAGFKKTIPEDFAEKISLYDEYLSRAFAFIEAHQDISITLRYEDLVTNPRAVLSKLMSRLGEPFDEAMLTGFCSEERRRGVEDPKVEKSSAIHSLSIGRWEDDLNAVQIGQCRHRMEKWLERLGYSMP